MTVKAPAAGPAVSRTPGRLFANAAWLMVGEVVAKVASFAFVIMVARALGAASYGEFAFAMSFVPLFMIATTWGIEIQVMEDVVRQPDTLSSAFGSGLVVRLGLVAVASGLAVAAAPLFLESSEGVLVVALVAVALSLDAVSSLLGCVFKSFERMGFHAGVLVANRILSTILAAAVLLLGHGIVAVAATYAAGSAGALVTAWLAMRRFFPPIALGATTGQRARSYLRGGATLGLAGALNMALLRSDAVVLQAIEGSHAVGLYAASYRFLDASLFVVWSIATAATPRFATGDRAVGRATYRLALTAVLVIYVPVMLIMVFGGRWLLLAVFPAEFAPAGAAVMWLGGAALLYGVAHTSRITSIYFGARKGVVAVAATALALNVALNIALIPRFGLVAAAASTFATEVVEATLLVLLARRSAGVGFDRLFLVPLTAGALVGGLLLALGIRGAGAVVVAPAAFVVAAVPIAYVLARGELLELAHRIPLPARRPA